MLNYLNAETNLTRTENGALAHKSTDSYLLDFFAQGGAMRNRSDMDIITMFSKAFAEDELLALRTLFYFRDIREGQGERNTFKVVIKYLADTYPHILVKNLELVPVYGRWDDMYALIDTQLQSQALSVMKRQFLLDIESDRPSLLGKWLKSENASSKETQRLAAITRKAFGLTSKSYRKSLSLLRKRIDIVESKMSSNQWENIEYGKLPSRAGMIYRNAFYRQDEERYDAYVQSLTKGEAKINANTLYPHEIVSKVWSMSSYDRQAALFDAMWKSLPDYIGDRKENSLAMVDVSGSMYGTPITVSIALGLYLAERNKGNFHNHFMTFSERPQMQKVVGNTIADKVANMRRADWGYSTDIEKAFNLLLSTAIKYNVPQEEMIDKLYIITDMEFNQCSSRNATIFNHMKEKYEEHGYKLPKLVFWNVDARNTQFPIKMNDEGVQLVSGFSPSIFKSLMNDKFVSPYDLMLEVINAERYQAITI
ncbi:DUF2828 family protein [Bacillus cereus]|nr:DUF2828 family protein [Bacillus cereus]